MTAPTWSFFNAETGLFASRRYSGSSEFLPANTPVGSIPMEGAYDWQAQRVDLATGQVVDYQPPVPPDTDDETFAWDAGARRWLASPTLAARKRQRAAPVQALIDAAEVGQDRAQREAVLALAAGAAVPAEAAQRLGEIETEVLPLRATLQAIAAATTQAELDAIP